MDELLSNVAFISMRLHRTIWCHGVQSQGPGPFAPIILYLDSPPAVMNVLCRSSKESPHKGNKRSTRTPGRPRAACLRPNLSLKIEFFSFYLPRHGVSKDYSCPFLLLSILLSIAYLLKCTLHDHLT